MDAICHWQAIISAPVVFFPSFFWPTFFFVFPFLPVYLSGEKSSSVISDIYSCDCSPKGESHIRAAGNSKASGNWSFVFINCFPRWCRWGPIKLTSLQAWRTNVWWLVLLTASKSFLPLKVTPWLVTEVKKKNMCLAWFLLAADWLTITANQQQSRQCLVEVVTWRWWWSGSSGSNGCSPRSVLGKLLTYF